MPKIWLDPHAPNTGFILGAALSGGDPLVAARMLLPEVQREYADAVVAYDAARAAYRKFSNRTRPPEVRAAYEAAKARLDAARKACG